MSGYGITPEKRLMILGGPDILTFILDTSTSVLEVSVVSLLTSRLFLLSVKLRLYVKGE